MLTVVRMAGPVAGRLLGVLAGLAVGFVSLARAGAAEPRTPIRVESVAGATCPSGETFGVQLLRRTDRVREARAGERAVVFRVELVGSAKRPLGRLTVEEPDGTLTEREVPGATCQEVVSAMALIAAVLVDPNASLEPLPPGMAPGDEGGGGGAAGVARLGAEEGTRAPARRPRANAPRAVGAAPRRAPPASPPKAPKARPARPRPAPPPARASAPLALAVISAGPKAREQPNAGKLGRWAFGFGPGLALEGATTPELAVGIALAVTVELGRTSFVSPLLEVSITRTQTTSVSTPSGTGEFRFSGARLLFCPLRFPKVSVIDVRPCPFAEMGVLEGIGKATSAPDQVSARWVALGAMGRVGARLLRHLGFFAEGGLVVPLIRHEFYFDPQGPDTTALEVPALGFSSRLGVLAVFE